MDKRITGAVLSTLLTSCALLGASAAAAWEAGDIIFRAGAAGVLPDSDSDKLGLVGANDQVEAQDAWSLGLTLTYMATNNIGVGVLAAWPFEHDIDGKGTISALGTVAETKHLPPTVTVQYHFDTGTNFRPYVGAGINYTYFFDEDTSGPALPGAGFTDLELDDSVGFAVDAGLDYELDNNWVLSGQVWYADIKTEATLKGTAGTAKFDVDIDPWIVMVGIGKKF